MARVSGQNHATITGARVVRQLLSEMSDRTTGMEAAWPKVGDVIAGHLEEQFESQGTHLTGAPWAPLNPDYLAWKIRKGYDPRILHQKRDMRQSLTSRPMAVEVYEPMRATFGTDDEKAAFHQSGTDNMKQRKIINVTDDFADDVNQVLARYIFEDRLDA